MSRIRERHVQELQLIAEASASGRRLTPEDLRVQLGVSPATIYNDLETLAGLRVVRTGGAIQLERDVLPPRFGINAAVKDAIARETLARLQVGSVVYLDTGSTCFAIAKRLVAEERRDIRLVTANPFAVSLVLSSDIPSEVVVLGGTLRREAASIHGSLTECGVRRFSYDTAIVSIDFLHPDADVTVATFSEAEVTQKRIAIEQAQEVIVVAETSKLDRSIGYPVASLKSVLQAKPVVVIVGLPTREGARESLEAVSDLRARLGKSSVVVVREQD